MMAISDASFAADDDRRSTSGLIILINGNCILWLSRKQHSVTKSATEAELMSLSLADSELRALINILNELELPFSAKVQCDNTGAKSIAEKSLTKGCRHVEIAYRSIVESIEKGLYVLEYVPGTEILADIMTKSLTAAKHHVLADQIMNCK